METEKQMRMVAAIAAMQGIISTAGKDDGYPWSFRGDDYQSIAYDSVKFADALIKELENDHNG